MPSNRIICGIVVENQWAFFKIDGFAGKRSLLFLPFLPLFCSRLIFRAARMRKNSFARSEFRSSGTGTLATQATILVTNCYHAHLGTIPIISNGLLNFQHFTTGTQANVTILWSPVVGCQMNKWHFTFGVQGNGMG